MPMIPPILTFLVSGHAIYSSPCIALPSGPIHAGPTRETSKEVNVTALPGNSRHSHHYDCFSGMGGREVVTGTKKWELYCINTDSETSWCHNIMHGMNTIVMV